MASSLEMSVLRLRVAEPGTASAWPILRDTGVHASVEGADEQMAAHLGYGQPESLLPYHPQDDYTREPVVVDCPVAILENQWLRATFLLTYGGRLWSLIDRATGRELLHSPDTLQPANLALRNAWFAGGVEWNLGATGHWPLTCAPMHAGRVLTSEGTPVLRMWEYERMRRLVMRLDAWLPAGSRVLYVRPLLCNPHPEAVPVYWWSNIAVPESDGGRVIAPATEAFHFGYGSRLARVPMPDWDGLDRSYPTRATSSADYFFDIPADRQPWIAAVDPHGRGLVQTSTRRLRGRKLFLWGRGAGGRHWQRWLGGDHRYLEIQAGLARTQLEHLPLPAGQTWSWTEAYGPLEVDPAAAHGSWADARTVVADALQRLVPAADLAAADRAAQSWQDDPPVESLWRGSGWGALEVRTGDLPTSPATPFADSTLGPAQRPWLRLWETGTLPASEPPAPTVSGPQWRARLEDHPRDWHALLHLGLLRYAEGDRAGARQAWQHSVALRANPWSLRNLGELARLDGADAEAADLLTRAHELCPGDWQLTAETLAALIAAGHAEHALHLIDSLDAGQRAQGRIRLHECRASLQAGALDRAAGILEGGLEITDLREGEDSLDALWAAYQDAAGTTEPLPARYEFRMHP